MGDNGCIVGEGKYEMFSSFMMFVMEKDIMFNWCSGYHVCLTRRRPQVRSLD